MYLGLTYSIAEMSPALPHTGGAYSFARTAFGPWGGFITGVAENVEYVLTPAVIVYFIGAYLTAIFGTPPEWQPVYWVAGYIIFVTANANGVELSFMVTAMVTLLAIAVLVTFFVSAAAADRLRQIRHEYRRGRSDGSGGSTCRTATGRSCPSASTACSRRCRSPCGCSSPSSSLPLAAEESVDPKRDMPKGIMLGMFTLIVLGFLVLFINPSIPVERTVNGETVTGAFALGASPEPILDGFRAIFDIHAAGALSLAAVVGLVASFHAIIFASGRQIYSLSRAGYFPHFLSVTHGRHKTPNVALIAGALIGLAVMLVVWFRMGGEQAGAFIGGVLLNMAVFGAMFSYLLQGLTFIQLRRKFPKIERPYRSPFGVTGAVLTVIIALITIGFQLADPLYRDGVIGVAIWYGIAILYFAVHSRKALVLSPEEEFAMRHRESPES